MNLIYRTCIGGYVSGNSKRLKNITCAKGCNVKRGGKKTFKCLGLHNFTKQELGKGYSTCMGRSLESYSSGTPKTFTKLDVNNVTLKTL